MDRFAINRTLLRTLIAALATVWTIFALAACNDDDNLNAPGTPSLSAYVGDATVTLEWEYPRIADTFNVYRSTASPVPTTHPIAAGIAASTFTDTGLVNGIPYYYVVVADHDEHGMSPPSNEASATPQAATHDGSLFTPPVEEGTWMEDFTGAPVARVNASGGVVDGNLYVIGGSDADGPLRSVATFDVEVDEWSPGQQVPAEYPAVTNAASVTLDGDIYVFGGGTALGSDAHARAAVYDPSADGWQMLPTMPTPRSGAAAVALEGRIYVIGGVDTSGASLQSMDVFDVDTGTWASEPQAMMQDPRDRHAAAVLFGRIFVFGGTTSADTASVSSLASVEAYDLTEKAWVSVASMASARHAMNAVAVNGRVVVLGGESTEGGGAISAVEEYDPIHDAWRNLVSMPSGRHGTVAGRVGTMVYVATGGVGAEETITEAVLALEVAEPVVDLPADLTALTWTPGADAPTGKVEAQGGAHDGALYTFGGHVSWDPYRTTMETARYDPATDTWTQLAEMPQAWTHAKSVTVGDSVLLTGGYLNPNDRDYEERDTIPDGEATVFRYDTGEDSWYADVPLLPEARGAGGFVRMGRNLHFFAGHTRDRQDRVDHWVLSLDHLERDWKELAPVPESRNHLAAVARDGYIYLIGGQLGHQEAADHRAEVFRYDPTTDNWTELASMPYPVSHHGNMTFADNEHIYVFGGEITHNSYLDTILRYSIRDDAWMTLGRLPSARHSAIGGFIDGSFWIATGSSFSDDTLKARP